jgi:hypothetical protein
MTGERGAGKKKSTNLPTYLPAYLPALSRKRGAQKHQTPEKRFFCKKSMSKTYNLLSLQKIRLTFPCQVLRDFLFYRAFGCFSAMGEKALQKTFLKGLNKKIDKNRQPKPFFFDLPLSRFWVFLNEGSPKTPKRTPDCRLPAIGKNTSVVRACVARHFCFFGL